MANSAVPPQMQVGFTHPKLKSVSAMPAGLLPSWMLQSGMLHLENIYHPKTLSVLTALLANSSCRTIIRHAFLVLLVTSSQQQALQVVSSAQVAIIRRMQARHLVFSVTAAQLGHVQDVVVPP